MGDEPVAETGLALVFDELVPPGMEARLDELQVVLRLGELELGRRPGEVVVWREETA